MLRWLWLSAFVVLLDQATKVAAETWLTSFQPVPVLPSLNLTLVYNTGAAFSFLAGAGGWQRWFFVGIALVVGVGIVVWLGRLKPGERVVAAGLSLVLGGAVGNVIDRIAYGHVIDFIDAYYGSWHWPAFNAADSAISVGAALLIIDSLFGRRRDQE